MILSSVMFLIGGVFFVTSRFMKRLYGPENEWSQRYGTIMAMMSAVMNMGVAFLTQNVAYLCNIYRWQILLEHLKHGEHTHEKI
jgi:divalent metal cation (Fe/Co/Zn/Cd) transporter